MTVRDCTIISIAHASNYSDYNIQATNKKQLIIKINTFGVRCLHMIVCSAFKTHLHVQNIYIESIEIFEKCIAYYQLVKEQQFPPCL